MSSRANDIQVGGQHYRAPYQHWDLVADLDWGYFEGQVTKYLTRWRQKNGKEDLEKARHYMAKMIELEDDSRLPRTVPRRSLIERESSLRRFLAQYPGFTREEKGVFADLLNWAALPYGSRLNALINIQYALSRCGGDGGVGTGG